MILQDKIKAIIVNREEAKNYPQEEHQDAIAKADIVICEGKVIKNSFGLTTEEAK